MNQKYELAITVPAYNEAKGLPELIAQYRAAKKNVAFQLVLVDNGSTDETQKVLKKEMSKPENSFVSTVYVKNNIGYGNGIHQGLRACNAPVIGWSHADHQCSPKDVFKGYNMYKKSATKKVLVKGHRIRRDWKSLILTYGFAIYSSLILHYIFDDINGQPKIFSRKLFETFRHPPKGFSYDIFVQYRAKRAGFKVKPFYVSFEKRIFGMSKWAYSVLSKTNTIKQFVIDVIKIRKGEFR